MKKPIFNQIERRLIIEDATLFASWAKLYIAEKKWQREFAKTYVARVFKSLVSVLEKIVA